MGKKINFFEVIIHRPQPLQSYAFTIGLIESIDLQSHKLVLISYIKRIYHNFSIVST